MEIDPNALQRIARHGEVEWSVSNFKSIEHARLNFPGISVITGANSAGKSSLIQSLLLLAQTTHEGQIALNGSLVSLGEAVDVIRADQKTVSLSLTLRIPTFLAVDRETVRVTLTIDLGATVGELEVRGFSLFEGSRPLLEARREASSSAAFKEVAQLDHLSFRPRSRDTTSALRLRFLNQTRQTRFALVEMTGLVPEYVYFRNSEIVRRREARIILDDLQQGGTGGPGFGLMLRRAANDESALSVLGQLVSRVEKGSKVQLRAVLTDLSPEDRSQLSEFLVSSSLLKWDGEAMGRRSAISRGRPDSGFPSAAARDDEIGEALHYLNAAATRLHEIAMSITHLGPLRDEPRVVSPMGRGSRSLPVGSHGEYTADFLARWRARKIEFYDSKGSKSRAPLIDAVSHWVNYLGIGSGISVTNRGKLGLTLRLSLNGVDRDLTTVGVGASQLLPVVVALLGAYSNDILLLEQPELHLHPAVQSRLGDFLALARPDVRIVVETHSENLLTRLRLRVIQDRLLPARVSIFFGEQEDGVTTFRRLDLSEFGDLSEWPRGFFDEGAEDSAAILRGLAKRIGGTVGNSPS